ncbi:MAG: signal peptidase II [Anaerolineales bacterium]|jgi:signal peptidase II
MSSKVKDYLILIGGAGLIVALDQWTKYLVRSNLAVSETWSPFEWLAPYVRIVHWNNTGAAFGMFPSGSMIFTVIAIVVSLAIVYYFPRVPSQQGALRLALVLQMGGALGNLISRLVEGTVTDFISIGSFAVFNVADSSISIGVAVLIAGMWLEERRASREPEDGDSRDEEAIDLAEAK